MTTLPRVVALGGGHGLSATLQALRSVTPNLTAVVTVADDGGSSGRIRRELDQVPPGDLRMALCALAEKPGAAVGAGSALSGVDARSRVGAPSGADAASGVDAPSGVDWVPLLQHRFGGSGALAGHAVGNLLISGLVDQGYDVVHALDLVAGLVRARGRVLPMSPQPVDLTAEVVGLDPDDPYGVTTIRGQVAVATTPGRVVAVHLTPQNPPATREALEAIREADYVVLGPGSWFTSVIPNLLVPELGEAIRTTSATRVLVLNLGPQPGETEGFSAEQHVEALLSHAPHLPLDVVLADKSAAVPAAQLRRSVEDYGGRLYLDLLARHGDPQRHDPQRLATALRVVMGLPAAS